MVVEKFVKQLDGCSYHSGGENCTCAAEAMWLYRASQGKINVSSCTVRRRTGDTVGGTNLDQMDVVSRSYGIAGGRIYKPIATQTLFDYVATGRYGAILQIDYSPIAPTRFDCFDSKFFGAHAIYLSTKGSLTGTTRGGDPGADGRRSTIPTGYQNYPNSLLVAAAGMLQTIPGGPTVVQRYGPGRGFAYLTPIDPAPVSPRYHALVIKPTSLWNAGTGQWVYKDVAGPADNRVKVGTPLIVRGAKYVMGGVSCYPIDATSPNYPGYFVPMVNVKLGARV